MSPVFGKPQAFPRRLAVLMLAGGVACGTAFSTHGTAGMALAQTAAQAGRTVRLDFVQADINDVAKALSIQSGANVVLMPSVKGKVTVRLIDIPLSDALKQVAVAVGSDVHVYEGTYFLGSTTELRAMLSRNGVKEVAPIQHAPPEDVRLMLQHALPYLTVEAVGSSKMLVLSGARTDIAAAMQLIREKDRAPEVAPPDPPAPPQPPVVVRDTYQVKHINPVTLTETLRKAVPGVKVTQVEQTLVLEAEAPVQQQAMKLITALDVEGSEDRTVRAYQLKYVHPHQATDVLKPLFPMLTVQAGLEAYSPGPATFSPLSVDTEQAFSQRGLQGGDSGNGGSGGGGAGGAGGATLSAPGFRARTLILAGPTAAVEQATQVIASMDVAPDQVVIEARVVDISPEAKKQLGFTYEWSSLGFAENNPGRPAEKFGGWTRLPFDWQVTLSALEETRDVQILARPNIAVVDGEQASIFIGDILRFERLSSVTAVGQTFTIETVPVGVALLCRPRVAGDDIMLRVHPVVSTVTNFTGRNRDIPITASREAESIIRMRDGETIAIGGLLREEEIKILSKVPILGDLPVLGQLFRNRDNTRKKSEITIFLTARVQK